MVNIQPVMHTVLQPYTNPNVNAEGIAIDFAIKRGEKAKA